jgi:hypothetical protein
MPSARKRKAQRMAAPAQPPKPRNPYAVLARNRASGPHGPSRKARRQQEKRALKKLIEPA